MTRTLLITSTEPGSGKTAVAIALGLLAKERGIDVGYMKPKGTRVRSRVGKTIDEDPMLARELLEIDAELEEMEPVVYSSTFVRQAVRGHEDPDELRTRIRDRFETLADGRDLVIVEGGGRWTTGGIVDLTDADVAELLDAEVLLVDEYERPEDLDEMLAAVDRIDDRLLGVLFNEISDDTFDEIETDVVPFLEGRHVPVYGILPRVLSLAGVTIGTLADEIGAELLSEGPTETYIERFVVGAMSGDAALRYFRRTKDAAVITGGDRSAVHTAALEAPGIECLILTGGHRPSSRIIGTAERKGVPILLLQTDTLSAIDRVESVVSEGRTRDATTVDRMQALLPDHADIDVLLGRTDAE